MIGVVVQDRRTLWRDGLSMVVSRDPGCRAIASVATADDVLAVVAEAEPDVVVIDGDETTWDPAWLVAEVDAQCASATVVAITGHPGRGRVLQAAGATVVAATTGIPGLLDAIRGPTSERVPSEPSHKVPDRTRLTAREVQVLSAIGRGLTTREAAHLLGVGPKTVENHKQRIFRKLGVQSQAQAIAVSLKGRLAEQ